MVVSTSLARLGRSLQKRPGAPVKSEPIPLLGWPAAMRGAPNMLLRSALFSASRKEAYLQRVEIYAQKPTCIRYTGARLNQADHDVWLTLLHLCREDITKPLHTSTYQLLTTQGKRDTGPGRKALYARLARLNATSLEVSDSQLSYSGSLVDEVYRDCRTHRLVILLNSKLVMLFGQHDVSFLDWTVRRQLTGKPLAQWVHGYYSSHSKPFPIRASTLLSMAGIDDRSIDSAEQNLRRALDSVTKACSRSKRKFEYEFMNGMVRVRHA